MQTKWVGKSLTAWGAIVMILPGLAQLVGIDLGSTETVSAAGEDIILGVSEIIGFVMVVLGRLRANEGTPVTLVPK